MIKDPQARVLLGRQGFIVDSPANGVLQLVILGKLRNFANKRYTSGWAKSGYQKRWRDKVHMIAFSLRSWSAPSWWTAPWPMRADTPKVVTMTAMVWSLFDAHDGLQNALKPVVDGLVRGEILHSDAPDCGHRFDYAQRIERKSLGVEITIKELP